ncbi:hypothetical protein GQ457_10G001540 [Hibiscus cannabinus]
MVKPQPESPAHGEPSSSSSKYKGVRKRKWGKWVSEIRLPNSRERIWLGSYDSPQKAAKAFDAAQFCLRGNKAKFNFPDNPPDTTGARSLSPLEIQAFASRFANESCTDNNNVGTATEQSQYASSPSVSVSVSDGGGAAIQVESNEPMDWSSFLSILDTNEPMSDYGFFPMLGDEFYPPPVYDNVDDNVDGDDDGFSQQSSFLWNF